MFTTRPDAPGQTPAAFLLIGKAAVCMCLPDNGRWMCETFTRSPRFSICSAVTPLRCHPHRGTADTSPVTSSTASSAASSTASSVTHALPPLPLATHPALPGLRSAPGRRSGRDDRLENFPKPSSRLAAAARRRCLSAAARISVGLISNLLYARSGLSPALSPSVCRNFVGSGMQSLQCRVCIRWLAGSRPGRLERVSSRSRLASGRGRASLVSRSLSLRAYPSGQI